MLGAEYVCMCVIYTERYPWTQGPIAVERDSATNDRTGMTKESREMGSAYSPLNKRAVGNMGCLVGENPASRKTRRQAKEKQNACRGRS